MEECQRRKIERIVIAISETRIQSLAAQLEAWTFTSIGSALPSNRTRVTQCFKAGHN